MKLFAKKPCSFNGQKFFVGEEIPFDYVLDPKAQEKMGVLVVVDGESRNAAPGEGGPLLPPSSTLVSVPILCEEGVTSVEMTPEDLVEVVTIIQHTDAEIVEKVKDVQSADQLLLISVLNGSDVVFKATKDQAMFLSDLKEMDMPTEGDEKGYSRYALDRMKKSELVVLCSDLGLELEADMKREEIINLILEKQGE